MPRKKTSSEKHWPSDNELLAWLGYGPLPYPEDWDELAIKPIQNAIAAIARVSLAERGIEPPPEGTLYVEPETRDQEHPA